jgi:methyl-accepting chemotaxis protein
MDEMTQQNAALVEEAAAASESLLNQADQLATNMGQFVIDEHSAHQVSARPALSAPKRAISAPAKPATPVKKPAIAKAPAKSKPIPKPSVQDDDGWEEF